MAEGFTTSMSFKNGLKCEWNQQHNKYQPWIHDGLERFPATLESLNNLPAESVIKKDGVFMKGNSDFKIKNVFP